MTVSSVSRTALFIDGTNLYSTAKTLGFDIDYKRLLEEFQSQGTLVRAFYYTAVVEDQEFSSVRPLLDWLDYNGFTVVTKPTKEFIDAHTRWRQRQARCSGYYQRRPSNFLIWQKLQMKVGCVRSEECQVFCVSRPPAVISKWTTRNLQLTCSSILCSGIPSASHSSASQPIQRPRSGIERLPSS